MSIFGNDREDATYLFQRLPSVMENYKRDLGMVEKGKCYMSQDKRAKARKKRKK